MPLAAPRLCACVQAIFVRLLVILLRNQARREEEQRRKRKARSN
jgi:hypothetical protein